MTFTRATTIITVSPPVTGTGSIEDVAHRILHRDNHSLLDSPLITAGTGSDPQTLSSTIPEQTPSGTPSRTLESLLPFDQPQTPALVERVSGMRKWEGKILAVDAEMITVELVPLDDTGPTLMADFKRSLLGPDDAETARLGDIVYLTVRTVRAHGHGPTLTSALRLRRLGIWTIDEVKAVHRRAQERRKVLKQYVD